MFGEEFMKCQTPGALMDPLRGPHSTTLPLHGYCSPALWECKIRFLIISRIFYQKASQPLNKVFFSNMNQLYLAWICVSCVFHSARQDSERQTTLSCSTQIIVGACHFQKLQRLLDFASTQAIALRLMTTKAASSFTWLHGPS